MRTYHINPLVGDINPLLVCADTNREAIRMWVYVMEKIHNRDIEHAPQVRWGPSLALYNCMTVLSKILLHHGEVVIPRLEKTDYTPKRFALSEDMVFVRDYAPDRASLDLMSYPKNLMRLLAEPYCVSIQHTMNKGRFNQYKWRDNFNVTESGDTFIPELTLLYKLKDLEVDGYVGNMINLIPQ